MVDAPLLVTLAVALLVESFFIHLSASVLLGGARWGQAILVAFLGSLLAGLMFVLLGRFPLLAFVLALVVWLSVAAALYRVGLLRALMIGLLAYVLWVLTRLFVGWIWTQLRAA